MKIGVLVVVAGSCLLQACTTSRYGVRKDVREVRVIQEIQTIHQAESEYFRQFGRYGTLAELGPAAGGAPDSDAADLIPASLASGDAYDNNWKVAVTATGYTINANPKVYDSIRRRTFYSDQTMVIRTSWTPEQATAASPYVH